MEMIDIKQKISIIEQAIAWGNTHLAEAERQEFVRKMVGIHREFQRIKYALSEQCAAATFGESQMGKSYLVNSMFSEPSSPFVVHNEDEMYVFKTDINPSEPNSQIEATGVVTRFLSRHPQGVPAGFVCAQLLSVTDIILILCEAYYNETDYKPKSISEWVEYLNEAVKDVQLNGTQDILIEDDILDIEEYFIKHFEKKCGAILDSQVGFFSFLLRNIRHFTEQALIGLIKKLWNDNTNLNRLFDNLIANYRNLCFSSEVYIKFEAILKKHGTLLDVARLDEMFSSNPDVLPKEYKANTIIQFPGKTSTFEVPKSYLSALIAELSLHVSLRDANNSSRAFFNNLDILDFPGACPDEQIKEEELGEPKKLSRVFRRGKVSYLFNKYSSASRISTLLFCHNNHQSKFGKMGYFLTDWIEKNIGDTPAHRNDYIRNIGISPFFVIGTWFNTDLEYANQKPGDDLEYLWQRRFKAVLTTDVLKAGTDEHWFNTWDGQTKFRNIYLLRDFDHSKMIFSGYDPDTNQPEKEILEIAKYPNFLESLRHSFIQNDFVREHFENPAKSWDDAASVTKDGTVSIMAALNILAPNIKAAREQHFERVFKELIFSLHSILEEKFHSGDAALDIKKAKKLAGRIILSMDSVCGNDTTSDKDPYFFIKLQDRMMVQESNLYEMVFTQLNGQQGALPMTTQEANIYMNARLNTRASREENLSYLMLYLGVDDEDECRHELQLQGVDIDVLLGRNQMLQSPAERLVSFIEEYWYKDFLLGECVNSFKEKFPLIGDVCEKLYATYDSLHVHQKLVDSVERYIKVLSKNNATGIIADYLAMELNHFTSTFGYDYYTDSQLATLEEQTKEHKLGIDWSILHFPNDPKGVVLLTEKAKALEMLNKHGYGEDVHARQMLLPQFRNMWRWQQELRLALAFVCHIPNYDVVANNQLGKIIDSLQIESYYEYKR